MKNLLLPILIMLLLTACNPNNPTPHHNIISKHSTTKAILKLDTKGHMGKIRDIIITKSKDIITASEDKTIRIWDSTTGKEKRKILGQIGNGTNGMIYTIALSPNNKFLAVGGFLARGGSSKDKDLVGAIRIYDYFTGKLLKLLKSHSNVVFDLDFSDDGKYLISGSADNSVKIWDGQNFSLIDTMNFHTAPVTVAKIIKKGNQYFTVSGGWDSTIALYNIQKKKLIRSHKKRYQLLYLTASKHHIATAGFGREIQIYDYDLNPIKTIPLKNKPELLSYSPNGKVLIAENSKEPMTMYNVEENYKKIKTFHNNGNKMGQLTFLNNKIAISTSLDKKIYIWNINTDKIIKSIEGAGEKILSVALNKNKIAWGNKWTADYGKSKLQKVIDLKKFKINNIVNSSNMKRITTKNGEYSLTNSGLMKDYEHNLDIRKNDKVIATISKYAVNGNVHRCYGFYKDYILSGAEYGNLTLYNLKGKKVTNLIGHTGIVNSIAIDGDRLVSGSYDQTIRVWDLSKLRYREKVTKIEKDSIASKYGLKVGDIIYSVDNRDFNSIEESTKYIKPMRNYIFHIIRDNKKIELKIDKTEKLFGFTSKELNKPTQIQPQLSLFISKNNEWIAWTPQGFYNASKGAEQYIGYHINKGKDKEAKFLDVSRFRKQFYRPDLIQKAINGEDISSYAKGIDIDSLLKAGLPPKVEILTTPQTIEADSTKIGVKVCDEGGGMENLNFYVDDKSIKYLSRTRAFRARKESHGACMVIEQKISIPSGEHTISFDATNQKGNIISNRPSITIVNNKKAEKKPNLHLLTLSINDYKDDSLDLKFPNNDADKLSQKLKQIGKPIFGIVNTYSLKDSQVTKKQIEAKVKEIAQKVDVNDVFVLYISGHGITNQQDGDYYFIPYSCARGADVTTEAINQKIFKQIMSQIKAVKSVILLDTCQSGSMASKELLNTSINRFGGNVGSAIIAGASSKQNAIDGYRQHGIFTYTVIDAMDNKKVYSFDDKLSINEVAEYVKYKLPKIAKEAFSHEQKPTIYMNGDTSFAIGGLE